MRRLTLAILAVIMFAAAPLSGADAAVAAVEAMDAAAPTVMEPGEASPCMACPDCQDEREPMSCANSCYTVCIGSAYVLLREAGASPGRIPGRDSWANAADRLSGMPPLSEPPPPKV